MATIIQIYVKAETRTRLKALAWLDNRSMAAYIEEIRSCMSGIRHPATLSNPET